MLVTKIFLNCEELSSPELLLEDCSIDSGLVCGIAMYIFVNVSSRLIMQKLLVITISGR